MMVKVVGYLPKSEQAFSDLALITATVPKSTPSQAFSSECTYLNIFAHCFISIETFLFEHIGFQSRLTFVKRPSYFNS